ncbi:protein [Escherichia coli]|uniref:Protein n=1 Tax=Escherichia coli TaxID=562 RepID=A0A484X039_ECOLX|nr:protein [Escherichia coli]
MSLVWAAPAQRAFSDWQVTCNNQNFCVARNTGDHNGLVMTLSRSAGAHTDAVLRIERGGLKVAGCVRRGDSATDAVRW